MEWLVVGAGTAGSVVAGRLAEAGHDVTIVEAGSAVPPFVSLFDALAFPGATFPGPAVRGRGLGGSAAVNGMVAHLGDLAQYLDWGWDDVEEAAARVRVPMERASDLGPVDRALLDADPDAEPAVLTRRVGRRVTPADAYLHDARLTTISGTEVRRIELDGDRATGVRLVDDRFVGADAVVIAAGAFGSPALLRASGLDRPGIRPPRNHDGLPVTLRLRAGTPVDVHGLVTGAVLRRDGVEITAMNHLGPEAPGHAMLLAVGLAPGAVIRARALVEELLTTPSFGRIVDDVTFGPPPGGVHHHASSCPMGTVVDDDGRVAGTVNLHVVDASVLPALPDAGPYLPTLVLGERLGVRLATLP